MKRRPLIVLGLSALMLGSITTARPADAQTVNCTGIAAWSGNSVAYAVGNLVTYQGKEYKCQQAHTSLSTWDPVDAASLWVLQGTCATTTGTTTGATCAAVPPAPVGLAAVGTTQTSTTITWTAVTPPANCSITSYTVFRNGTSIGTATTNSFAVSGLTAGTTYQFSVLATDSFGNSPQSAAIAVSTPNNTCTTKPGIPGTLTASNLTSTSVTISWPAVTPPANCSITGYTVFKNGASVGTTTSTSMNVSGLTASTTYSFTVAASDAAGTGTSSAALSVTTPAAPTCTTKPSAPTGLAASGTTNTSTTLNWSAVTAPANCSISGYTVYKGGVALTTVSSGTSYTATGLSASTTYSFTVAAVDGAGTGTASSAVSVTTSANPPPTKHFMAGYWHNWGGGVPYIPIGSVNSQYDIILVAFGIPANNQVGPDVTFAPTNETDAQFIAGIGTLHGQGRKVILSIGGGNAHISLNNSADINTFVTTVSGILNKYPFDGIDIDFENDCLHLDANDLNVAAPTTPVVVNLISALNQLHAKFPNMMLTFAPETFMVQLGYQFYGPGPNNSADNRAGSQLAVINAVRSWVSYVWTQDYQSLNIKALDNTSYAMGNADFQVAMTEMLLRGFPCGNGAGTWAGIPAAKIGIGCGANANAANGFVPNAQVKQAIAYLTKGTSFGGAYHLQGGPYPGLGGVMVWSLSWDNLNGNAFSSDIGPVVHALP